MKTPEEFEDMDDDYEDEEDEEDEEEIRKTVKKKSKKKTPVIKQEISDDGKWQLQRIPEIFRVIDPSTKEIVAEALSIEELRLQLEIITAQNSTITVKNTE